MIWLVSGLAAWSVAMTACAIGLYARLARMEKSARVEPDSSLEKRTRVEPDPPLKVMNPYPLLARLEKSSRVEPDPPLKVMNPYPLGIGGLS